ncbi:MAG: hypothetical protein HY785_18370 [Oscillatoriophycideae cyanobacterium NC_groundwater_1537_Pr4_S-0.65um_50_18]|nr:hypothetical protein [Oscillatoriophycideae cyanobacterium NC_groundwater_1537_Pr4_S-0.65um_50_18]
MNLVISGLFPYLYLKYVEGKIESCSIACLLLIPRLPPTYPHSNNTNFSLYSVGLVSLVRLVIEGDRFLDRSDRLCHIQPLLCSER